MSGCVNYSCNIHIDNPAGLNVHSCSLRVSHDFCEHSIKFQSAIKKINPLWKEIPISCTLDKDNYCIEVTETFSGGSLLLCPISQLKSDTDELLIVKCIKSILELLLTLDENGWAILDYNKKTISHKTICNSLLIVRSDGSIVQSHKHLVSKRNKPNNMGLLPKTVLYFLCRETKSTQGACRRTECRLKKQQLFFKNFDEELLHRCFCESIDSTKSNEFQKTNIKEIFQNIVV